MNNVRFKYASLLGIAGCAAALLYGPCRALAAASPTLGAAGSYSVLAGSTVTVAGATLTSIAGDLGVSPGSAITGFPPGVVGPPGTIHLADASAAAAQLDNAAAFLALSAPPNVACDHDFGAIVQDLVGLTLVPGVYCANAFTLSGTLTLDDTGGSAGVWIFRAASTVITAAGGGAQVKFLNGVGSSCNVWWQVGSSATIGSSTTFIGNILALASIGLGTNATVTGRTLAQTAAVTMDGGNTVSGCVGGGGAVCGNDIIESGETCDDGNTASGDGCSSSCAVEAGYQCVGEPSVCTPLCGDGLIRGSETCDDGNTASGDGCSSNCAVEAGYECVGEPSVCTLIALCADVAVDKQVCSVTKVGEGCTGGALGITIQYTGSTLLNGVTIKASSGRTVTYGTVHQGDILTMPTENGMTIDATAGCTSTCKLGTTVTVLVGGTVQEIFHTSCSCPDTFNTNLVVGEPMCLDSNSPDATQGKGTPSPLWTLVALRDPTGLIGAPDPSVCNQDFALPKAPCSIKKNRISELTFEYVGAEGKANNCANQQNSQDKKARACKGAADDTQPVALTVTDGGGGVTFFNRPPAGAYMLGDTFTVRSVDGVKTGDGKAAAKKNFPGDLAINVYAPSNLKKTIEEQQFKSDCSKAINIGDVFGGFKVTGITSTKGGVYTACIPVEYRYAVTNNAASPSAPLWLCDDKVATVCQVTRNVCASAADCDPNDANDTCGPIAGNVTIGAGATVPFTANACVAPATENTVVAQAQPCPAVPSGDPAFCAIDGAALPPPPPPTPGPCQRPLRLRLEYTGQPVGTCDGINDVTVKVTASSGPTFTHVIDCLNPGDLLTQNNGWSLDGGSTTLATVVSVEVLDNGTAPTVCSGGNVTGTNPCTTIDQCKVGGQLDHEIFASTNVAITKGCVEEMEKFHTSCSCNGNPDVNLVIGHQMCLDSGSGTNDSGQKGEPSHLWKLDAREPL
jgi:cysteine-rich repeat protein